jgi:hypothetical protein
MTANHERSADPLTPTPDTDRVPMMDRPAYELVRLIESYLDDADQFTDTPQRPNNIAVWGIRMLLEPYGGKAHRWQWPMCFECKHQMPLHKWGPCDLCGCAITPEEIIDGERDEGLDEAVEQALRFEQENRYPPGACGICGRPLNEVGTSRCYEAHGISALPADAEAGR